jgi:hypothetical protein
MVPVESPQWQMETCSPSGNGLVFRANITWVLCSGLQWQVQLNSSVTLGPDPVLCLSRNVISRWKQILWHWWLWNFPPHPSPNPIHHNTGKVIVYLGEEEGGRRQVIAQEPMASSSQGGPVQGKNPQCLTNAGDYTQGLSTCPSARQRLAGMYDSL